MIELRGTEKLSLARLDRESPVVVADSEPDVTFPYRRRLFVSVSSVGCRWGVKVDAPGISSQVRTDNLEDAVGYFNRGIWFIDEAQP